MVATVIEFSRYFIALLFGAMIAVSLAGLERRRKNYLVFGCFVITLFILQVLFLITWGMDFTGRVYPLLSHLPVVLFIVFYIKRPWLIAFTSMFVSFLCCQFPSWIGSVAGAVFDSVTMNHVGFMAAALLMYYILQRYVVKLVQHLMNRSVKSCLLFAAMPAFYYFYDQIAFVYTGFIYSGTRAALQFMPFLASVFYFVFVLFYYEETQKQARMQRDRDILDTQFKQAQNQITSLRRMHQNAAAYRHDMRHHISLLQALASKGKIEEIKDYLQIIESDIEGITPVRYCENENINLILAGFSANAKQEGITLTIEVSLPEFLHLSDTELCSLLSNAIENAIQACKKISDSNKRFIKLRMFSKCNKLCLDIRNSYESEPVFYKGLPVSKEDGHGYGTKSMARIVEKHGGVFQFSVKDGWFIFQATT